MSQQLPTMNKVNIARNKTMLQPIFINNEIHEYNLISSIVSLQELAQTGSPAQTQSKKGIRPQAARGPRKNNNNNKSLVMYKSFIYDNTFDINKIYHEETWKKYKEDVGFLDKLFAEDTDLAIDILFYTVNSDVELDWVADFVSVAFDETKYPYMSLNYLLIIRTLLVAAQNTDRIRIMYRNLYNQIKDKDKVNILDCCYKHICQDDKCLDDFLLERMSDKHTEKESIYLQNQTTNPKHNPPILKRSISTSARQESSVPIKNTAFGPK